MKTMTIETNAKMQETERPAMFAGVMDGEDEEENNESVNRINPIIPVVFLWN